MSEKESKGLFRRSDGFWEDGEGNFAVVMKRYTKIVDSVKHFSFRTSFGSVVIELSWPTDQHLALFPYEVVVALISRNYGRLPTAADMPEPEKLPADGKVAPVAPALADKPALPPLAPLAPPAAPPIAGAVDLTTPWSPTKTEPKKEN